MQRRSFLPIAALCFCTQVAAEVPDILLEACSLLDSPGKRVECLRAATGQSRGSASARSAQPQALMASPTVRTPSVQSAAPSFGAGGSTCYVGPRGGTYTITKSGKKNYGGC